MPFLGLGVGALVLRVVYLVELWPTPLFSVVFGDGRQYITWAREIAGGQWLGTSVFYQAPLYPYLLALVFKLTGAETPGVIRIVQIILGGASCLLLAHAGRRFVNRRAGLAAGWMLALYPPAIFFDGLIQKSSVDLFLVTALLALLGELTARRSWRWLAAAGLVLGLLTLNRENARVLYPVVAARTWWFFRDLPGRRRAVGVGVFTVALLAVLLPVGLRNYAVGGEFLVSTSQLGPNFYIGNHAGASGAYEPLVPGRGSVAFEREDATRLAEQATGRPLSPGEVSDYWVGRAVADIRSQPGSWLRLVARKLLLTVSASEVVDTESIEFYSEYSRVPGTLFWFNFGVVLPLGVLGAWLTRAGWREHALLYAMGLALAVSVAAFYVLGRYRFPLVPLAMIFAGAGVAGLLDAARSAWRRRLAFPSGLGTGLVVAALAAVVSNLPLQAAIDDTRLNVGEELVRTGQVNEALPLLEREAAISPDYSRARLDLGVALSRLGEKARSVGEFQAAVRLAPNDFDARSALALALAESGDGAGAIEHFREAARLRPADAKAQFNLANALQQAGQPGEAVPHYEAALRARPDYVEALANLSLAFAATGDAAGALTPLSRAAQLQPDSAPIHFNLAEMLTDLGRASDALPHYEDAARLAPNSLDLRFAVAQAYARGARWSDALASLDKAAALARAGGREDALRKIEAAMAECRARGGR